ncbi:hypothetical protein ACYOEI_11390 [Singulisphaera rosea]
MNMANVLRSLRFRRFLRPDEWAVLAIMIVVVSGGIWFLDLMPGRLKGEIMVPKSAFRLIAAHESDSPPPLIAAPKGQTVVGLPPIPIPRPWPGEAGPPKALKGLDEQRDELNARIKALSADIARAKSRAEAMRSRIRSNDLPPSNLPVDRCLIPAPQIDQSFVVPAPQIDPEFVVAPRVVGRAVGYDPVDIAP